MKTEVAFFWKKAECESGSLLIFIISDSNVKWHKINSTRPSESLLWFPKYSRGGLPCPHIPPQYSNKNRTANAETSGFFAHPYLLPVYHPCLLFFNTSLTSSFPSVCKYSQAYPILTKDNKRKKLFNHHILPLSKLSPSFHDITSWKCCLYALLSLAFLSSLFPITSEVVFGNILPWHTLQRLFLVEMPMIFHFLFFLSFSFCFGV